MQELTVKPTSTEVAATTIATMLSQENPQNDGLFDKLCASYNAKKATLDAAKADFDLIRDSLRLYAEKFGYVPTGADKTIRYETPNFQADVQRGIITEIDDSRVEHFQTVCRNSRLASLFPRIFERHVSYTLTKEAQELIKTAKPTAKFRESFFAIYALCFRPKPKSPSLTVLDINAEATKKAEAAAAREAKKAAKKSAGKKVA